MTEYVNITNINDLANAIRERNAIERDRLKFEKEMFEFNKQINLDIAKANTDMANTIASVVDKMNNLSKHIEVLAGNDAYFKKEIDALNFAVMNLQ